MEKERLIKISILALPIFIIVVLIFIFNLGSLNNLSGMVVSEEKENAEQVGESIEENTQPSCDNGIWDGDESDMDCGGLCPKCLSEGIYRACWDNSDCESGICDISKATRPLPEDYTIEKMRQEAGKSWVIQYQGICS